MEADDITLDARLFDIRELDGDGQMGVYAGGDAHKDHWREVRE